MTNNPLPGEPGGAPYDQEKDWGQVNWSDYYGQSNGYNGFSEVPEAPSRPRFGIKLAIMNALAGSLITIAVIKKIENDQPIPKLAPAPLVMPKPVQERYDGMLEINYDNASGSAVKIGENLAVTAGHVVMDSNPSKPMQKICSHSPYNNVESVSTAISSNVSVINWAGKYGGGKGDDGTADYAVVQLASNADFNKLPSVPIARQTLTKGEDAFFINYQSIGNVERVPSKAEIPPLLRIFGLTRHYEPHAAEFAGVLVGTFGKLYVIATGLAAYGSSVDRQTNLTPGGSGGAVLNKQGQLEGISVASNTRDLTANDVDSQYRVRLPISSDARVGLAYVQPINSSLVAASESQMQTTTNCE